MIKLFLFTLLFMFSFWPTVGKGLLAEEEGKADPFAAAAQTLENGQKPSKSASPIPLDQVQNTVFKPGEKFLYVIKYEFMTGGQSTLEVSTGPMVKNRPTYQFLSKAESNDFVDVFFKVRDLNGSLVDASSLSSLAFHQNLHEGHYQVIRTTLYDYEKRMFTFEATKKGKLTQRSGPISGPARDILSAFYFTRTLPLKPGSSYFVRVFAEAMVYPLRIDVDPKVTTIEVPAGRFECIKVQPFIVGDALFKARDGRIFIWLTNDERRIPVLIRSKVMIGAFDAELKALTVGNPN